MYHKNFKVTLAKFYVEQKYCDMHFIIKKSDGSSTKIGAHKLVLSAASEMFETIFYEQQVEKNVNIINVDDVEEEAFRILLNFIYQIDSNLEQHEELYDPDIISEFYKAAHKFSCKDALEFGTDVMLKILNAKNVILFYELANFYDNTIIKDACVQVFNAEIKDILTSPSFLESTPQTVEAIFGMQDIRIDSEVSLVRALEKYICHHEVNHSDIREKLRPALNCIRFLTLTPKEIAETELLTEAEVKKIISCLPDDNDLSEMPVGFSLNRSGRLPKETLTREEMEGFLKIVFNSATCRFCSKNGFYPVDGHSMWDCLKFHERIKIRCIAAKYHHKHISRYTNDDLQRFYDICKNYLWFQ